VGLITSFKIHSFVNISPNFLSSGLVALDNALPLPSAIPPTTYMLFSSPLFFVWVGI